MLVYVVDAILSCEKELIKDVNPPCSITSKKRDAHVRQFNSRDHALYPMAFILDRYAWDRSIRRVPLSLGSNGESWDDFIGRL